MTSDEIFMQRAMELARNGAGSVSPNPMVGCVIVHDEKIVGEGWHQKYGEAHAEVNAINSLSDKSILKDATLYVTLEPCAHHGKTPPCADMLIEQKVKKVVIANEDPNPLVGGKGMDKLKKAGIEVVTGVLRKEGIQLNNRFFTFINEKRPYIILKWAQTSNGFIARENFESKWISNEQARQLVHKWRAEEDAILVGYNTALHDNPRLTVRDWSGKNPTRIVIDKRLELSNSLHLFDQTVSTICYNTKKEGNETNLEWVKVDGDQLIDQILAHLYQRNIQSVIIEGGAQTINYFLKANLWDEARVITSPIVFDNGIAAPEIKRQVVMSELIGDNKLCVFENAR